MPVFENFSILKMHSVVHFSHFVLKCRKHQLFCFDFLSTFCGAVFDLENQSGAVFDLENQSGAVFDLENESGAVFDLENESGAVFDLENESVCSF